MFTAYQGSATAELTDIARSFGVLYSALAQRARIEGWCELREARRADARVTAGGMARTSRCEDPAGWWRSRAQQLADRYAHERRPPPPYLREVLPAADASVVRGGPEAAALASASVVSLAAYRAARKPSADRCPF